MHNPPHTGEFIREVYLEPNDITGRQLAAKLGVSPSTLAPPGAAGNQWHKPGNGTASIQITGVFT